MHLDALYERVTTIGGGGSSELHGPAVRVVSRYSRIKRAEPTHRRKGVVRSELQHAVVLAIGVRTVLWTSNDEMALEQIAFIRSCEAVGRRRLC